MSMIEDQIYDEVVSGSPIVGEYPFDEKVGDIDETLTSMLSDAGREHQKEEEEPDIHDQEITHDNAVNTAPIVTGEKHTETREVKDSDIPTASTEPMSFETGDGNAYNVVTRNEDSKARAVNAETEVLKIEGLFVQEVHSSDEDCEDSCAEMGTIVPEVNEATSCTDAEMGVLEIEDLFVPEVASSDEDCEVSSVRMGTNVPELIEEISRADAEDDVLDVVYLLMSEDEESEILYNSFELIEPIEGIDRHRTIKPDTLVVVGGQEFRAHRNNLSANSKFFKERFAGKGVQCVWHVDSPCVTAESFKILLNFMYKGTMDVSCQKLAGVVEAASYLGMERASVKCRELSDISSNNLRNAVYLYAIACQMDLSYSKARALNIMTSNFESLVLLDAFLDFTIEQIKEIFLKDTLGARSEIVLFLAALKWLHHDFLSREEHAGDVMRCVRFPAMTKEEALACFHPPLLPGLMEMPEILSMLQNALCYICAKSVGRETFFQDLHSRPRRLLLAGKPLELWDLSLFHPDWNRQCAAVKIQAAFRGYRVRRRIAESSSEEVRKWFASFHQRQESRNIKEQRYSEMEDERSTTIQPSTRNYKNFLKSILQRQTIDPFILE